MIYIKPYMMVGLACCGMFLTGCQKRDVLAAGPEATVSFRDGTRVSGTVLESTPAQITLRAFDGSTRVLDMRNVRGVDYGDAPAAPIAAGRTTTATTATTTTTTGVRRTVPVHNDGPPTPPRYHPEESHISTRSSTLPVGTRIAIRTDETIDSQTAVEGQIYAAEIYRDVLDPDGDVVLPQGANAQLAVRSASRGGRFKGTSDLLVDLASVSVGGRQYAVGSADLETRGRQGFGTNKRTAEFVGGGSALGAIIGAIAGQGKGAAIGAGAGAGAGVIAQVATKGSSVRIPAETVLTFQLDQPLRVAPSR